MSVLTRLALALLSLVGLAASIELTRLHYLLHTDPAHQSWCHVGATINCDAVERSSYAVLFGVPLAVWGVLGYLVFLGVLLSARWSQKHSLWPRGALWGLGLLFTVFSAYNAYISFVLLEAMCLLCLSTYVTNLALLLITGLSLRSTGLGLLRPIWTDLRSLIAQPLASGLALVAFLAVTAALMMWYPNYWQSPNVKARSIEGLATGQTPEGLYWIGASNPAVTIIEFSDYQCPYCSKSHAIARDAVRARPQDLRLVHRQFPLDMACNQQLNRPFHHYACYAAKAVECAGQQGQFWSLNDKIFANQQGLSEAKIDQLSVDLGLNLKALKACIDSPKVQKQIQTDIAAAVKLKVRGTPFYLVNGKAHAGGLTAETMQKLIDESDFAPAPGN